MNDNYWLQPEGTFDPSSFDGMPITVKTRFSIESKGLLSVESKNNKGQIRISVSYNSSPFANTNAPEKFYLSQEQLNEFQNKGAICILTAPAKKLN